MLIHKWDAISLFRESTPMPDVIYAMTCTKLGTTAVVNEKGMLSDVISDGDLRRLLEKESGPLEPTAERLTNKNHKTTRENELAEVSLS